MIGFESVLSHPLMYALGCALLHFIWQGAVVAILLAIALFVLGGHVASLRYGAALGAMLLMPALLTATTWKIWASSQEIAVYSPPVSHAVSAELRSQLSAPESTESLLITRLKSRTTAESPKSSVPSRLWSTNRLESLLPWFVSVWLVGVLALSLRLAFGWTYTQRLKRQGITSVLAHWQERLAGLCEKMRVTRPVCLLKSALVQVPTAIGWLRPVILLPANALTGLTPRQLEAILAHELAHIQRYDYLFNLLQTAVETLLFYHPAVWWISNRVRIEREHCCDKLAVKACGDTLTYARALTKLEQLRSVPPQLAMAASGGSLLHRIRHIINAPATQSDCPAWQVAGAFVIITIFIVGVTAYLSGVLTTVAGRFVKPPKSETAMPEQVEPRWNRDKLREIPHSGAPSVLIGTPRDESEQARRQAVEELDGIK